MLHEMRLQVWVSIHNLLKCLAQFLGITILHHVNLGHIVLCRVTIQFPIKEDTTLVLRDGIVILLAIGPDVIDFLYLLCASRHLFAVYHGSQLVNRWMLQDFLDRKLYTKFVEGCHRKAHR